MSLQTVVVLRYFIAPLGCLIFRHIPCWYLKLWELYQMLIGDGLTDGVFVQWGTSLSDKIYVRGGTRQSSLTSPFDFNLFLQRHN